MTTLNLILLSGAIGGAMGSTVFFAKEEPYKIEIVMSSIIRNILVGLLISFTVFLHYLFSPAPLLSYAGWGALYGFLTILVVFLSKGRDHFKSHLPIILFGTITGAATGIAIYFVE